MGVIAIFCLQVIFKPRTHFKQEFMLIRSAKKYRFNKFNEAWII